MNNEIKHNAIFALLRTLFIFFAVTGASVIGWAITNTPSGRLSAIAWGCGIILIACAITVIVIYFVMVRRL